MFKQLTAWICMLFLICCAYSAGYAEDMTMIKGSDQNKIRLQENYPDSPVIEGMDSLTGLPASGEPYTPILVVIDNAEEAHPHWGVSKEDIMFQVPNAGAGATKLLALFANEYPEQAGGVRSARATMLPIAMAWDAAFVYAGMPPLKGSNANVDYLLRKWNIAKNERSYNMLLKDFKERVDYVSSPHNLSCHVGEIHRYLLSRNVAFEQRPFLFTDEERTDGEQAMEIKMVHKGGDSKKKANPASTSRFTYNPELHAYIRSNSSGDYIDRDSGEAISFANVIVLRTKYGWENNYVFLARHLVGKGVIEIFQNGRYVRGAWLRESKTGRLILIGPDGKELQMQRGKTFIVVTNKVTEISYR